MDVFALAKAGMILTHAGPGHGLSLQGVRPSECLHPLLSSRVAISFPRVYEGNLCSQVFRATPYSLKSASIAAVCPWYDPVVPLVRLPSGLRCGAPWRVTWRRLTSWCRRWGSAPRWRRRGCCSSAIAEKLGWEAKKVRRANELLIAVMSGQLV